MKDRQWNTPNQTDPWESCAEWESWVMDKMIESSAELFDDLDPTIKAEIYGIFCDMEDKHNDTIAEKDEQIAELEKKLKTETEVGVTIFKRNADLSAENKRKAEQIGKLSASLELALNQRKIDKAENERLKEELAMYKSEVKAAPPQKGE